MLNNFVLDKLEDHFPETVNINDYKPKSTPLAICIDSKSKEIDVLKGSSVDTIVIALKSLDSQLLAELSQLKALKRLWLLGVRQIEGKILSKSLETVLLRDCPFLDTCEAFIYCTKVKHLSIEACSRLTSLEGLQSLSLLSELQITGRPTKVGSIESLAPISTCKKLCYLSLASKVKEKSLSPIYKLTRLEYLWLCNLFREEEYRTVLETCRKLSSIQLHNGDFSREKGFTELEWD